MAWNPGHGMVEVSEGVGKICTQENYNGVLKGVVPLCWKYILICYRQDGQSGGELGGQG